MEADCPVASTKWQTRKVLRLPVGTKVLTLLRHLAFRMMQEYKGRVGKER